MVETFFHLTLEPGNMIGCVDSGLAILLDIFRPRTMIGCMGIWSEYQWVGGMSEDIEWVDFNGARG